MASFKFQCTGCDFVERLSFYPDCCSICGGPMVPTDQTTTVYFEDVTAEAFEAQARLYEGLASQPATIIFTSPPCVAFSGRVREIEEPGYEVRWDFDVPAKSSAEEPGRELGPALLLGAIVAAGALLALLTPGNTMAQCERSNSFDTCFTLLNR